MVVVGPDSHDRRATGRVIEHNEISSRRVDHGQSDFGAHMCGGRVVPDAVRIEDEVDERVEGSVGHRADVDG